MKLGAAPFKRAETIDAGEISSHTRATRETDRNMKRIQCGVADGRAKPTGDGKCFFIGTFVSDQFPKCAIASTPESCKSSDCSDGYGGY